MKKILLLIAFVCITLSSYSQSTGGGVYVFEQAFDANGYEIKDDGAHPQKIMVTVLSTMFGCTAGYTQYNHLIGMWETANLVFNYAGTNNGWFIFRLDVAMYGTSFLYVYNDFTRVRVAMSYKKGGYYQYRKFIEGEDINMTPTR